MTIYDVHGRLVQHSQEGKVADLSTMPLQNLPGGMYLLQWTSEGGQGVVKFLIE